MTFLPSELRNLLEKAVCQAREISENAAHIALSAFGVDAKSRPAGLDPEQGRLRNKLRARARQLANDKDEHDPQRAVEKGMQLLTEQVAYVQWHRMLFARVLAENNLLMHPSGVPVTLQECEELAPQEGEPDAWQLAARYAGAMLPGIFRPDDPSTQVRFALEGRVALENLVAALPSAVFTADDALGWVYQFWQSKKKQEVNKSERKIGGADLAPVTQLFTEDYMVRFLLENTLGAWWAARHPNSPLVKQFDYLRFLDDGTPAAGTFPGWPDRAALITMMDPCCGSGHFDVAAFEMLRQMRMEEEGLSEAEAADAVLRDNIFGLELDPRCTQIAAFALALAAWKAGGYRKIPVPHIACSGIAVQGQLSEWTKLAGSDVNLKTTLERLYELFKNAPDLGSLINPADVPARDRMFTADYATVEPLLEKALAKERGKEDTVAEVFGAAAEEVMSAARLLARTYTLVPTNVPYLLRRRQGQVLQDFLAERHPDAKTDLATAFVERCRSFCDIGGSTALVTPQNWLFLVSYKKLRTRLLRTASWLLVAKIGENGFDSPQAAGAFTALSIFTHAVPGESHSYLSLDASTARDPAQKATVLKHALMHSDKQADQLANPDARIAFGDSSQGELLEKYAICLQGIVSGDSPHFTRCFWEMPRLLGGWEYLQSTVDTTRFYGGREHVIWWKDHRSTLARVQGLGALEKRGILVAQMRSLAVTLYTGELFDVNGAAMIPRDPKLLPALWQFCSSPEFSQAVRHIDRKINVTNATLVKVPFDLAYWQKVAQESDPLPEPHSDDPTQWLFDGIVNTTEHPLQVAVARLLGYAWPQQKDDGLGRFIEQEGIVCLPAVAGMPPAAERLRALLTAAYNNQFSPDDLERLLSAVGFAGKGLDEWLRDGFFVQHCQLFQNRPFIWHIWDGRRDGFSALVNYHKLDAAHLERLIYTYLGAWIEKQRMESKAGTAGADGRLVAARQLQEKLTLIREGEPPYDIYVRWKPLHEQPIGWEPDLNDGVRLNIRPFVEAGVLRSKFTINWNKDRGKNPDGSERLNDRHFSREQKQAARRAEGRSRGK